MYEWHFQVGISEGSFCISSSCLSFVPMIIFSLLLLVTSIVTSAQT